jgi:hypothetical protein
MSLLIDVLLRIGGAILSAWLNGFGRKQAMTEERQIETSHETVTAAQRAAAEAMDHDALVKEEQAWTAKP